MNITGNDKLAQYIRDQEHTWAKIYDASGALVANYSGLKSVEALAAKVVEFVEKFPNNYCFEFKKNDTANSEVVCRVKLLIPVTDQAPVMQGAAPSYSPEEINKRVDEGIKAGLADYKRQREIEELRAENRNLKTGGGKFANAIALAFDLWFEHRGQSILAGITGQQAPEPNLNGTPQVDQMQDYKQFNELEQEEREKVITGIDYILSHFTPEEIQVLGIKLSNQPEMIPFVRNFLKM